MNVKKAGLREHLFLHKNASKSQDICRTRFNARAIIDSETGSLTEEPIHEYFATMSLPGRKKIGR